MTKWRLISASENPARLVLTAFTALIVAGTALLRIPAAFDGTQPSLLDSLFTSTSATTVTGLATLNISEFSALGEVIILILIQVGGFGIMALGAILSVVASHRMGLHQRKLAAAEFGTLDNGVLAEIDLRGILRRVAEITILVELVLGFILFLRLWTGGYENFARSLYSALFHSISSFNNAGISLYSDSLERFSGDPFLLIPMSAAFILGGFGFPIIIEVLRQVRGTATVGVRARRRGLARIDPKRWSLHAKITVTATLTLIVIGPLVFAALEWANPSTLGPLDIGEKLLTSWFQGTTPRTAGFSTIDIGGLQEPTLLFVTTLMFIGAGPASTSGGIKITTFAVLAFVIWAEVRGRNDVNVFGRRLSRGVVRQAITIALLSVGLVITTALILVGTMDVTLTPALFEATSAFGTVGLSTGLTAELNGVSRALLTIVMLAGRIGPMTFVTAIALKKRDLPYRFPEERPIIG
ncbi:MAG: TrkH family potassium uptake protein [Ilumatobacteraceae bacterium]|nr:TrkH family potassium uptake protein [Actinomycetota bacterium]